MDSINEVLDKIVNFLSDIQNACDNKRMLLEQCKAESYALYLEEWKTDQRKLEKENEVQKLNSLIKEENTGVSLAEDFEEISLANALLEKARIIRSKTKGLPRQSTNVKQLLSSDSSGVNKSNSNSVAKSSQKERPNFAQKDYSTMPCSKSTTSSKLYKSSKMTQSKSLYDSALRKESSMPTNCLSSKKTRTVQTAVETKRKSVKDSDKQFISNEHYSELKCIAHHSQKTINNDASHSSICISGSHPNSNHESAITYQSFQSSLQGKLKLKSHFELHKDGFWYTFISMQNQKSLLKWSKCNTFETFIKVTKLLYKIQETLLWIDLLSLLGKDVLPYVKILDEKKNSVRFCHYFSSLYHESLQRIPLLSLNVK